MDVIIDLTVSKTSLSSESNGQPTAQYGQRPLHSQTGQTGVTDGQDGDDEEYDEYEEESECDDWDKKPDKPEAPLVASTSG